MIDQLKRIRPVVYANDIHGNINAQRNAHRIKLLRKLRPMLQSLQTHHLPRYPCYLLAHPSARRHSTLALLAQQQDIPCVACFWQASRHCVVHCAAMANALTPSLLAVGPKIAASKDDEENNNNAMGASTTEGPSQLPKQD